MKQSVGRVVLLISLNQASSFSWPALASSSSLDRIDRRYGYGSEIQDVTCFSTIIHNNGMSSSVLLYVSGRRDIDENDTKNTKRENYVDRGGKKHMKKSEIDDLVRGMLLMFACNLLSTYHSFANGAHSSVFHHRNRFATCC